MAAIPTNANAPLVYLDPSYAPPQGVFISANGRIVIVNGTTEYEVVRVSQALIRVGNNISQYFEAGAQTGLVYAGLHDASGSISRAFINLAEWRLVAGAENSVHTSLPTILGIDEGHGGNRQRSGSYDFSRYPINNVKVHLEINDKVIDGDLVKLDKTMFIICHNVAFNNTQVAFNSRDLITSGPLDFIGSHASIKIAEAETVA